ncbi:hypothetical protein BDV06DRAFT_184209 [Aspergillus oleicola]
MAHNVPLWESWGHMLCQLASSGALFSENLSPEFRPVWYAFNGKGWGLGFMPDSIELRQQLIKEKRLLDNLPYIDAAPFQTRDQFSLLNGGVNMGQVPQAS